jgi:hypothetical protein
MKPARLLALALVLFVATQLAAATRTIRIFEKRQIVIAVPEGWKFNNTKDNQTGVQTVTFDDRAETVDLRASFLPDSENHLATREALEARMRETFAPMLEGSVEKEMEFTFRDTADGTLGYTVFTDKKLVDGDVPPNEWRYATVGIRSWPGVAMNFTILSNDLDSEAYKKALEVVTSGLGQAGK